LTIPPVVSDDAPLPKGIEKRLAAMRANPKGVRFSDALKVAEYFFEGRRGAGSHHVFKTPWPGLPRVNLQNDGGSAKEYQVGQLIEAVDKLRGVCGD
jgi:hypothetical protein